MAPFFKIKKVVFCICEFPIFRSLKFLFFISVTELCISFNFFPINYICMVSRVGIGFYLHALAYRMCHGIFLPVSEACLLAPSQAYDPYKKCNRISKEFSV